MISFTPHARQRAAERGLTGKNLTLAMRAIAKHGNRDGEYVATTGHRIVVQGGIIKTVKTPNMQADAGLYMYKL